MNKINRINYIVQENPNGVAETLLAEGINPSTELEVLTKQTKQWVQKAGKSAIIKLLQVHPEKAAILSANASEVKSCDCKSSFDGSGCGCKSSFDGSACACSQKSSYSEDQLTELKEMNDKELQLHYQELKRLLKQFPDDEELQNEVETVWQFIRAKKSNASLANKENEKHLNKKGNQTASKAVFSVNSKDLAVGAFIFGIALIISQIR